MAGSISLSLSQQFDEDGSPLAGGKLYFFEAGTVATPQDAFKDYDLSIEHPNPIILDDAGRVPAFYLADGFIKIRLTDSDGVTQVEEDTVLVIGPSSGSGSAIAVDATTVLSTGDMKVRYSTGTHAGWVRANGRTIGSASSSATERANSDTEALFTHLYNADANLTVSGGRGANAAADFAANKTIALPDWRGRALAGLDDMGNSAAGRLTSTYFGTAATALGAAGGSESNNVILTHDHDVFLDDDGHTHTMNGTSGGNFSNGGNTIDIPNQASSTMSTPGQIDTATTGIKIWSAAAGTGTENSTANAGSASAHNIAQPTMLATIFIKL